MNDASVRRSTDEGRTWEEVGPGPAPGGEDFSDVLVTPAGRLLVGGYHAHRSAARVLDAGPPPAEVLALAPPAPNPCALTACVAFRLVRRSPVDLARFDLAGRRVVTLSSGVLDTGPHAVALDASALPVGLYLCRL